MGRNKLIFNLNVPTTFKSEIYYVVLPARIELALPVPQTDVLSVERRELFS